MNQTMNDNDPELVLDENFGDPLSLWNSRKWLQEACEAKGAKFTGGGCGFGEADIDIILEGHEYHLTIKPVLKEQP